MAEIKITFDLTFNRRFIRAVGVVGIMLCAVPELESESVTLSTYYPAPSGVYTQMITTGNTFLARDIGSVAVRTTAVGNSASAGNLTGGPALLMDVNGTLRARGALYAGNSDIYFTNTAHNHTALGNTSGGAAIENDGGAYDTLMILGRQDGMGTAGTRTVGIWDRLDVNGVLNVTGNANVAGNLDVLGGAKVTGPIQSRQGGLCTSVTINYGAGGGSQNVCAGRYVTMTDGIYAKRTVIPVNPNLNSISGGGGFAGAPTVATAYRIEARCCPCPSGGCSGM